MSDDSILVSVVVGQVAPKDATSAMDYHRVDIVYMSPSPDPPPLSHGGAIVPPNSL